MSVPAELSFWPVSSFSLLSIFQNENCSSTSLHCCVGHTPDPLLGTEGRWKNEANPYIGGDSVVREIKLTDDNCRTTADDVKVQKL